MCSSDLWGDLALPPVSLWDVGWRGPCGLRAQSLGLGVPGLSTRGFRQLGLVPWDIASFEFMKVRITFIS